MKSILEGSTPDLLNNVMDFLKYTDKETTKNKQTYLDGSISNATKNLIMTFPVLCDNSLSPTTSNMISKANERNIISMLQILFTSMQINAKSGQEALGLIHKNINNSTSVDDIIDIIDNYTESTISTAELNQSIRIMMEQLKTPQKSFPVNSLNESSLNDYKVLNILGKTVVKEETEDEIRIRAAKAKEYYDYAKDQREEDKAKNDKVDSQIRDITRQLMDSDVKKSNELQPSLMVVKFNEITSDGTVLGQRPFVAGVKSRLIAVDSGDIVDRIIVKDKTKINFKNFIRATTGEIRFFKDFLFCTQQAKVDAKNSAKKGIAAQIWKTLENRSAKNFANKTKKSNDASAITTLVINQETANIIRSQYNFDLENIKNAKLILDSYNLLGLFIADESIDVVKVLYAGNDTFEQISYSSLERESNDNSYKKVVNLIGKMNGGR